MLCRRTVKVARNYRIASWILILSVALTYSGHMDGQVSASQNLCATPEIILDRYVAALGGNETIKQIRSLIIQAHETEPHTFNPSSTEHHHYEFKWKFPNRIVAKRSLLLPDGVFIFDGASWSNFNGRVSHNEDRTPKWVRELRSDYPYNDYPHFMMYRVVADPLLIARTPDLYSNFAVDRDPSRPDSCVLEAIGFTDRRARRHDRLYFDAVSGLLKTWEIQMGGPDRIGYTRFEFADYRSVGNSRFPFSIYFDFYKAVFRVTKVVINPALSDSDFVPKP